MCVGGLVNISCFVSLVWLISVAYPGFHFVRVQILADHFI